MRFKNRATNTHEGTTLHLQGLAEQVEVIVLRHGSNQHLHLPATASEMAIVPMAIQVLVTGYIVHEEVITQV